MNFILKNKILFSVIFYLLWGSSFFANILNLDETSSEILIWSSNVVLFICWIVILLDMIQNDFRDKTFWILSMFLLPFFTPIVYIFRRKNLIHLKDNKFKNTRKFK